MRIARLLAVVLALALAPLQAGAARCKLALVLALDVSSSVDQREYSIQALGLADALRDERVIEAILAGPGDGIMAAVFEWSGFWHQKVIADWTWLGSEPEIRALAARVEAHRRDVGSRPTAIGQALLYARELFDSLPQGCDRQVVDISGDGVNNRGTEPDRLRERGAFEGMIINGLVILGAIPDPKPYYENRVIHGAEAFVEVAESYADYPEAIRRKLLRELLPSAVALRSP